MPVRYGDKFLNNVRSRNKKTIEYIDRLNNIKYLYQRDFLQGTYRITEPGKYKLYENIIFHPNPNNGFKPRDDQTKKYPRGAYILGFFAVITIETSDVKLDLNGYKIEVSEEFNQNQRFASIIECSNSPFLKKQGPADFGEFNKAPSNVTIYNGHIGLSPHHGIRANNNTNLILRNISFRNFEVAAISLHGCKDVVIDKVNIHGTNRNVYSLSRYSQSLFVLPFLERIVEKDKHFIFRNKYAGEYYNELLDEIENFQKYIFEKKPYDGIFKNNSRLPDGNVYGILLHTKGVAVGDMLEERSDDSEGNENIYIKNTKIQNIISQSIEILGVKNNKRSLDAGYTGKLYTGPVGDVLMFDNIINENKVYNGNILSDIQLLIAKRNHMFVDEKYGTTSIPIEIVRWAENKSTFNVLKNIYFENGNDSMGHVMKGNHGVLISCGKNINFENVLINNIRNVSLDNKSDKSKMSCGICFTGSKDVNGSKITIKNIHSNYGKSYTTLKKNTNTNINI